MKHMNIRMFRGHILVGRAYMSSWWNEIRMSVSWWDQWLVVMDLLRHYLCLVGVPAQLAELLFSG